MQTFSIAPASLAKALWLLPVILIPITIAVVVLVVTLAGAKGSQFEVSPAGLRLKGDFYGRLIPPSELRVAEARRVDFAAAPEFTPRLRTMGTGLPGYQAGWFRLRSGERALVYLTDRAKAVLVPTTAGFSVLVSPDDPDGFLRALSALRR